jgi:hypothetical protein
LLRANACSLLRANACTSSRASASAKEVELKRERVERNSSREFLREPVLFGRGRDRMVIVDM